jgi:hypothetical protein
MDIGDHRVSIRNHCVGTCDHNVGIDYQLGLKGGC